MKPLQELSPDDLTRHPVWLYLCGEDGRESIAASRKAQISESSPETYVVLTTFELADGSVLTGYSTPQDDSGLDYIQPVIVTEKGHLPLFYEKAPPVREPEFICRSLAKSFDQIFPLRYRAKIPVDGRFVEGVVEKVEVFGEGPQPATSWLQRRLSRGQLLGASLFVGSLIVALFAAGLRSEILWAIAIVAFLAGDALMIFGGDSGST
jgi:hypothetical protein